MEVGLLEVEAKCGWGSYTFAVAINSEFKFKSEHELGLRRDWEFHSLLVSVVDSVRQS
jgi:hypothetical protein